MHPTVTAKGLSMHRPPPTTCGQDRTRTAVHPPTSDVNQRQRWAEFCGRSACGVSDAGCHSVHTFAIVASGVTARTLTVPVSPLPYAGGRKPGQTIKENNQTSGRRRIHRTRLISRNSFKRHPHEKFNSIKGAQHRETRRHCRQRPQRSILRRRNRISAIAVSTRLPIADCRLPTAVSLERSDHAPDCPCPPQRIRA